MMSKATIKANEKNLARIFHDDYLFQIPPYQRPYAWTTDEAGELFDDIWSACKESDKLDDLAPYFLGSIVLIKSDAEPRADVVDGQQRLTTLTILLTVLRDLAETEKSASEIDEFVKQAGNSVLGTADEYRLTARKKDAQFFRDCIQSSEPTAPPSSATLSDSQRQMLENREYLKSRVGKLSAKQRGFLVRFLAQKCFLVAVEASDQRSAYRVFSVMNDRGLNLAATDILKADIIGALPEADQDHFNTIWEDLEDHLGRERFVDLFSHIRMIHRRQKAQDALTDEFRAYVKPVERPREFIKSELEPYADAFAAVVNQTYLGTERAPEINKRLRQLSLLDNADWQPAVLVAFKKFGSDETKLAQFLKLLDRLAFQMFTARTNVNDRIRRYASVLDALDENLSFESDGHPLRLTAQEQRDWLEYLDEPLYPKVKIRRPILLRLDEAVSDGAASYGHDTITIEHVCPQTIDPNSEWGKFFEGENDAETIDEWVHSIANLVLLTRKKNAAASNWEFKRKKREYFTKGGTSSFALTTQVANTEQWTWDALCERQISLIEILAAHWEIDGAIIEEWKAETYDE